MAVKPNNSPDWCINGIKRDPIESMKNFGWKTSDGTVNGVPDKPTLEHTNGWMHNVGEFIKFLIPLTSDPIGTISMSMLTEQQMNQDNAGLWVLCDGRNCGGTGYAQLTGNNKVPDLRNKYLVGAGTNSDGTFFANLLDEKQAYIHSEGTSVSINVGGSALNIGGDTLAFPSDTMSSVSSIDTNNFEISIPLSYERIFDGPYPPRVPDEDTDDGGLVGASIWPGVISPTSSGLQAYNWDVVMNNHTHTFSFSPSPSVVTGQVTTSSNDADITDVEDITFADNTFMHSMKTNIFIRIN